MKVSEIMSKNVITARESESIREVALRLRKYKITGVPVLDENGKVSGVFSETDLMNQLPDILNEADQIPLVDFKELTDPPVKQVMGKPAMVVSSDTDIREVAKMFLERYIHRVPVVENGELVGIVSLGDLLKAFSS